MTGTQNKLNVKSKFRRITGRTLDYMLMLALAVILLFPYAFMFLRSLMLDTQVMRYPVELWPEPFDFGAYITLFTANNYFNYFLQTAKVVVFNLIAVPLSASFVAYGFSKYRFRGKKFFFAVMMGTMMLPGSSRKFLCMYFSTISAGWTLCSRSRFRTCSEAAPIYVFLIRQYMIGIPKELEEAAKIDGANPLVRYFRITLPLCVPILTFIMVTVFNANWSDFYTPLLYLSKEGSETLAYAIFKDSLYTFVTPDKANLKMAAGTFMSVFPAILFVIFQKQLIEGVSTSALKG